jgi:beta-phosphoglucomutase-like phosphatase (HAD superfamily)
MYFYALIIQKKQNYFFMSNRIKAVIFDMDGVLIDAKDWHYEALNKALRLFGVEISRYDHLVTFDGLPTKDKLHMLSLEKKIPVGLHSFVNEMKQIYTMEIVYSTCKPTFYHQYALSFLRKENYKIAVCSNSIKNSIQVMMEKSGLIEYLDFFLSNQDVKKGKPDPEMYITAIDKLGLRADECLIVEDNPNGLKAAYASGAHVLEINQIEEVNYYNIKKRIIQIENND